MNLRCSNIGCLFALGLGATVAAGCGLIVVPHVQEFPGPVREIRVVDATSGDEIDSAAVRYEVFRHENWVHWGPTLWTGETATVKPKPVKTLDVQRTGGSFCVAPCRMTGSMQWFFPLPLPLGWTLYRDHEALVTATAPGYGELSIRYAPENASHDWPRMTAGSAYAEFSEGALRLGLEPATR